MIKYGDKDVIVTYYYLDNPYGIRISQGKLSKDKGYFPDSAETFFCLNKEELIKVGIDNNYLYSEDDKNLIKSIIGKYLFIKENTRKFSYGYYLIIDENNVPLCVSNDFEKLIKTIQSTKNWIEMYKILSSGLPIKITL